MLCFSNNARIEEKFGDNLVPIILKSDPIFTFDTRELGSFNINGFSLHVAERLSKKLEKFRKYHPEEAIRHFLTLVAYHKQANNVEEKKFISHSEAKRIDRTDLVRFSVPYRENIRIFFQHGEKNEDLNKILTNLDDIEKLRKILIFKVEQHQKQNKVTAKSIASISGSSLHSLDIASKFTEIDRLSNAASLAINHLNRFDALYDNSFSRITKDIQFREELLKNCVAPFHSSYADILSSLTPELDRARDLYSSSHIFDLINQTNSSLETLFSEQTSIARLAEEATSINKYWRDELDSMRYFSSGVEAAKLALGSHYDCIAQASILAQEHLLSSHWGNLENSIFHNTSKLSSALDSFNSLTENYNSLIHSFSQRQCDILDFPPFVSGLPPIEILTSAVLIDSISRDENEEFGSEANALETEIREDIESSLEELLVHVNPEIKILWRGAKSALSSTNPDKKRHVVVSLREMLTHILHGIAPDSEVSKWTSDPAHFHQGRPTREARLLFVCRDINNGPFEQFVSMDVESHIKFIRLFQRGTHEININFTDQQLKTLIVRSEALARFLLITWKNTI